MIRTSNKHNHTSPVHNLSVIDAAFGPGADLYHHVLGVQPNASGSQIQNAFLHRRRDLLEQLENATSTLVRQRLERQIDAVVLAVRILGEWRNEYDDIRAERVRVYKSNKSISPPPSFVESSTSDHSQEQPEDFADIPMKRKSRKKNNRGKSTNSRRLNTSTDAALNVSMDSTWTSSSTGGGSRFSMQSAPLTASKPPFSSRQQHHHRGNRGYQQAQQQEHQPAVVTPDHGDRSQRFHLATSSPRYKNSSRRRKNEEEEEEETLPPNEKTDDGTLQEDETIISEGTLKERQGLLDRVRDEIIGALEDTTSALEQVLNVFTLQEEDIAAVTGKIHKAKRQMKKAI